MAQNKLKKNPRLPQRHRAHRESNHGESFVWKSSIAVHRGKRLEPTKTEPCRNHSDIAEHELRVPVVFAVRIFRAVELEAVDLANKAHLFSTTLQVMLAWPPD